MKVQKSKTTAYLLQQGLYK